MGTAIGGTEFSFHLIHTTASGHAGREVGNVERFLVRRRGFHSVDMTRD